MKGEFKNMTNGGEPNVELNTNETKRTSLLKAHNDMMIGYNFCRCLWNAELNETKRPISVWKIQLNLFHATQRTSFQQIGWVIPQKQNQTAPAYGALNLLFGI